LHVQSKHLINLDIFEQIISERTCHQGIIHLKTLPSGSQRNQMSSSMLWKT